MSCPKSSTHAATGTRSRSRSGSGSGDTSTSGTARSQWGYKRARKSVHTFAIGWHRFSSWNRRKAGSCLVCLLQHLSKRCQYFPRRRKRDWGRTACSCRAFSSSCTASSSSRVRLLASMSPISCGKVQNYEQVIRRMGGYLDTC